MNKTDKVLVCITAQSNSKRLINKGHILSKDCGGELHILHVLKGDSIFNNPSTPELLQELFDFGAKIGGIIHAYCHNNIPESIVNFVKDEGITKIVLGEPPRDITNSETQLKGIISDLPEGIEIVMLGREDEADKALRKVGGSLRLIECF